MTFNEPEPGYVALPGLHPAHMLEVGDRFLYNRRLVEITEVRRPPGRSRDFSALIREVGTGHPRGGTNTDRKVTGAQVRVDRSRLDQLVVNPQIANRRVLSPEHRQPALTDVLLTCGQGAYLRQAAEDIWRDPLYLWFAGLTSASSLLWPTTADHELTVGEREVVARNVRLLGAVDGGLTPAGQALLDVLGDTHRSVTPQRAWTVAFITGYGGDETERGDEPLIQLISRLAPMWGGTGTELLAAARTALADDHTTV